jgi:hypothetical protein
VAGASFSHHARGGRRRARPDDRSPITRFPGSPLAGDAAHSSTGESCKQETRRRHLDQEGWTHGGARCRRTCGVVDGRSGRESDRRAGVTDGAPSAKTVETLYDHLDFVHALNAFLTAFPAASTQAIRQGFLSIGAQDNTVVIFSELMDSSSRFLTANADTVYYVGIVDLTDGPMVVETPPMALGTFDDMWFQWIIDFGMPGPDRGAGGKFVLVPQGYDGPLPEGGFYVGHSRTNRVLMLGRSFMQDDDPAPTVATIKATLKLYPYTPGGPGTSVATLLEGTVPPRLPQPRCPRPGSWREAA